MYNLTDLPLSINKWVWLCPIQTKLIVSSMLPRDQETYENDTVRVEFIDDDNVQSMINKYA